VRGADALRRPRCAGGVDQAEIVPRLNRPRKHRALGARAVEELLERDGAPRQLDIGFAADEDDGFERRKLETGQTIDEAAMRDQHLGLRDPHRVLEIPPARGQAERRVDGAGGVRAEPRAQDIRAGRHPHRHVVAALDPAVPLEAVGRTPGLARGLRAGPRLVLKEEERPVRRLRGAPRDQLGQHALIARGEVKLGRHGGAVVRHDSPCELN
jgi:hypothetical protein